MEENKTAEKKVQPQWNAVYSVAFAVAGLIIAEFLPASLLTPMASDLGVSEGTVGQAISVTAVAMVASLFTAVVLPSQYNRHIFSFPLFQKLVYYFPLGKCYTKESTIKYLCK